MRYILLICVLLSSSLLYAHQNNDYLYDCTQLRQSFYQDSINSNKETIVPLETITNNDYTDKAFYMSIKTNMLYDVLLTPNIGIEFNIGKRFSVATNWMYAWWKNDNKNWYWRTYGGDISIRKWFGKKSTVKPLTGNHIGLYTQALTYDFQFGGKGYLAGESHGNIFDKANFAIGIEYGYSLPIAKKLNLDFTLGVGYMWGIFYECTSIDECYVWQATKNRRWIGPTKAEISLVWLIGRNNINVRKEGKR